jgi:hypothetical protein
MRFGAGIAAVGIAALALVLPTAAPAAGGQSRAAQRGGPRAALPATATSWPRALRAVRAWLSPWTALQRWWQAWSNKPPPPQLQALISSLAAGGLHL